MSSNDPDNHFPYPTKGVTYAQPPWVADFSGSAGMGDGNESYRKDRSNESVEWERSDQSHGDDPPPGIGDELADQAMASDLDQGTFGVELEFLVVQCPKVKMDTDGKFVTVDQHPKDHRWLSTMLSSWEVDYMRKMRHREDIELYLDRNDTYCDYLNESGNERRSQYSRTKLTRVLRDRGLVVIKWPEASINRREEHIKFVPVNNFNESEESDDEREEDFPNMSRLGNFKSSYDYDESRTIDRNLSEAAEKWQHDYENYHRENNLKIYRTRGGDITTLANKMTIEGCPDLADYRLRSIREVVAQGLRFKRTEWKQQRENERNNQIDPLHVPVPGLRQQYKAWTVTTDLSVDGTGMTKIRYAYPNSEAPWDEYYWFGAEVVSPVLPMGDERSREAVRVACGSLRDAFRCHKPMRDSTGLHIHLGHTRGWTLLQAKKFATFWFLTEMTIHQLHRYDRHIDRKWCAKIRNRSRLWCALFSVVDEERRDCAGAIQASHPPSQRREYEAIMEANVPVDRVTKDERKLLYYLWQYDSITALNEGLGQNQYCRTGIKWRIRGQNSSLEEYPQEPEEPKEPGTIEVRIMQGTLDADHINNWVVVLEHIVHVVRNLSEEKFQVFLRQFLACRTYEQLLTLLHVPDDIQEYWKDPKRRDSKREFWEYPDKDEVDWIDPFMVSGHKATHGAFWD
ncbi:hypothetical protein F4823DRAFT_627555 [Ustulina deusta]|nr:hypothetical protein F4823DRAFT_627555 [Ustulina deusta]